MPRYRTTPEAEILKNKWHNSECHNDAAKLHALGIVPQPLTVNYAKVKTDRITTRYFLTEERLNKFLRSNPDEFFEITILKPIQTN